MIFRAYSVAGTGNCNGGDVVQDPFEYGRRNGSVAIEDVPVLVGFVGGEDDRAAFVAL